MAVGVGTNNKAWARGAHLAGSVMVAHKLSGASQALAPGAWHVLEPLLRVAQSMIDQVEAATTDRWAVPRGMPDGAHLEECEEVEC